MGCVKNVSMDAWPEQGDFAGRRTEVCFHRNTERTIMGRIVRNDVEEPFLTIIRLDDGRFILGSKCQHAPQAEASR